MQKRLDDTNFVNPESSDLYIDEVDDENDVAHGDITQTPGQDEYANMNTEERTDQDNIDGKAYDKYIWAEVMMDVPGEGPRRATVRQHVENEDSSRAETYHRKPLINTREYVLEYDDGTHD